MVQLEPISILVLTSEPKFIKLWKSVGSLGDVQVDVTESLEDFEACLDEEPPNLVFFQADDPSQNTCLEFLKSRPECGSIPRILMSLEGGAECPEQVSDVMVWPFTAQEALNLVRVHLRWSRRLATSQTVGSDARQAEDIKRNFLSVITHELRTPLAKILGLSDNIVAGVYGAPAPDLARAAEGIKVEASRLNQLFNQIIDLSKMTAGDLKMERTLCRVDQILDEILLPMADRRRVEVKGEGSISVWIDRRMVGQMFGSMISNALKFSSGPVGIQFSIRSDSLGPGRFGEGFAPMGPRLIPGKEYLAIEVSDAGEGIDAEKLPLIFDKFTQADSSSTRKVTGLGIGLSLVKEIVAVHGGKVLVSSQPGQGTSMLVALPLDLRHGYNDTGRTDARSR